MSRKDDKPISLYPLSADDAIEAALRTPPPPKKDKKEEKKRHGK